MLLLLFLLLPLHFLLITFSVSNMLLMLLLWLLCFFCFSGYSSSFCYNYFSHSSFLLFPLLVVLRNAVSKDALMILYIHFLLLLLQLLRPLLAGDVDNIRVFCLLWMVLLRQLLLWRLCHIELFLLHQLAADACWNLMIPLCCSHCCCCYCCCRW